MRVGPDRLPVGDPDRQHQDHDRRADGQRVRQAGQAGQDQDGQHRLGPVGDRGQRVRRQHGQRHELAHPLHRDRAGIQRRAEHPPPQRLAGPAQRRARRLGNARRLDRRQLPVPPRDGHDPGEPARADIAGPRGTRPGTGRPAAPAARPAGQRTPGPTRARPRARRRADPRQAPGSARRAAAYPHGPDRRPAGCPAGVLPRLSRSRPPAISRAAATRSALAVLRHARSSSRNRPAETVRAAHG